jgi:hypothetical protein
MSISVRGEMGMMQADIGFRGRDEAVIMWFGLKVCLCLAVRNS